MEANLTSIQKSNVFADPMYIFSKNGSVDTHPSTIQFVPECYKTQMCYKEINRCFFVFNSIPDQYQT